MNEIIGLIKANDFLAQKIDWGSTFVLDNTRLPLISLRFLRGLKVDIQFGNIQPIQNTLFLKVCNQVTLYAWIKKVYLIGCIRKLFAI